MKKYHKIAGRVAVSLFAILFVCVSCNKDNPSNALTPQNGKFVRIESTSILTPADVVDVIAGMAPAIASYKSIITGLVPSDIVLNKVLYTTYDPSGKLVEASGIIAWPANMTEVTGIVSVQHGTCDIDNAPSSQKLCAELLPVIKQNPENPTASEVVIMADYLGYGASRTKDLQHPYMHAGYTGKACADLIFATDEFLSARADSLGFELASKDITLIGYSQGGQASMATYFELIPYGYESRVTKVIAGGGPYDLSAFFTTFASGDKLFYTRSGYVPYVIRGLAWGDQLKIEPANVYAPEVISSGMADKFSTTMLSTWHSRLGGDVNKVLNADFFAAAPSYNGNKDVAAVMASLESNSLINRKVEHPEKIVLYHSKTDEQVPYACSKNAGARWGCGLLDLETQNNHTQAGVEFYLIYLGYWDLFKMFLK